MAFPQIAGSQKSNEAANTTNHDVTLPASIAAGDLIIAWVWHDGNSTFTWPGAWQELLDQNISTVASVTIGYLIASGGETTVAVTSTGSERSTHLAIRITGWHGTTPPAISTSATGSSNAPNPDSLNPADWDVEDTLWIAWYGVDSGGATAFPLPDNNITSETTTSAAFGAICSDELAQASLDPSTFTNSASDDWRAGTIAVRPAAGGGVTTARGHAQAQAWIENTYRGHGQTQARIKNTYRGHGQSQADIKQTYTDKSGQSQAQIKTTYRGHGQAQADIKAIGRGLGQAQADIKQTYTDKTGQAQADIKQTYRVHAQANALIAVTAFVHGQANAYIKAIGVNSFGQAQANIEQTYNVHGQAQGQIEQTYNQHGQSQADIKQTDRGYGQAQGWIEATYNSSGQAQASIEATYTIHGQCQALIYSAKYGFGQAQGLIEGQVHVFARLDLSDSPGIGHNKQSAQLRISLSDSQAGGPSSGGQVRIDLSDGEL